MSGPPSLARPRLDKFGIDALCEQIINGVTMTAIAKSVGVTMGAMIEWIAADPDRSARAREARSQASMTWDEAAEKKLEEAADPFELAKARELAFHLRWRASKIAPKIYGDRLDLNATLNPGTISDDALESRILDFIGKARTGLSPGGTGAPGVSEKPAGMGKKGT